MTLDDLFGEGMGRQANPRGDGIANRRGNNSTKDGFSRSDYIKARALLYYFIGGESIDNLMFNMTYGNRDIVIRNRDGFHYGRLLGYDGKMFYLKNYHFDRRLIDEISYTEATIETIGRKAAIPAANIISVSEIPSFMDELAYA